MARASVAAMNSPAPIPPGPQAAPDGQVSVRAMNQPEAIKHLTDMGFVVFPVALVPNGGRRVTAAPDQIAVVR